MIKRLIPAPALSIALLIALAAPALPAPVQGAQDPPAPPATPQPPRPGATRRPPHTPRPPAPPHSSRDVEVPEPPAWVAGQGGQQMREVNLKLERAGRVTVSNRAGDIQVTGYDGDSVQATVTSDEGPEMVAVRTRPQGIELAVPLEASGKDARIVVRVPRYAELESVQTISGNIEINGIEGAVVAISHNGGIRVKGAGRLEARVNSGEIIATDVRENLTVRAQSGDIRVESVGGTAEIASTSGDVVIRNVKGAARASALSGDVVVECVNGPVELNSASGSMRLESVGGNVDANTVSGDVIFRGKPRADGRYRLKTLSGEVAMILPQDAPGFTATLVTYSGEIETDFALQMESPVSSGPVNRRLIGRYGDGQTRIYLDSFSGTVRIVKNTGEAFRRCP